MRWPWAAEVVRALASMNPNWYFFVRTTAAVEFFRRIPNVNLQTESIMVDSGVAEGRRKGAAYFFERKSTLPPFFHYSRFPTHAVAVTAVEQTELTAARPAIPRASSPR